MAIDRAVVDRLVNRNRAGLVEQGRGPGGPVPRPGGPPKAGRFRFTIGSRVVDLVTGQEGTIANRSYLHVILSPPGQR